VESLHWARAAPKRPLSIRSAGTPRGRAQPPGLHGTLRIVEPNLDECVLCELSVQAGPGEVRVVDSYE